MLYSQVTTGEAVISIQSRVFKHGVDYLIDKERAGEEVWVSAAMVLELLPQNVANDSGRLSRAMAANGWRKVRDRRAGPNQRGYVQALGKARADIKADVPANDDFIGE
jgi:hypothetical protein